MFLLFGLRGGRRGRIYLVARLVLLAAFLIAVFAFHVHGTALDILQVVRVALVVALVGFALLARRRERRAAGPGDSN